MNAKDVIEDVMICDQKRTQILLSLRHLALKFSRRKSTISVKRQQDQPAYGDYLNLPTGSVYYQTRYPDHWLFGSVIISCTRRAAARSSDRLKGR